MRRALITGASSYLGGKLAERLISSGVEVHSLRRVGSRANGESRGICGGHVHACDASLQSMQAAIAASAPDIVFHLASHYVPEHQPSELEALIESNFSFGLRLLEALRGWDRHPVRIVNAGTHAQHFEREHRPYNLYAACKQAFQGVMAYYADAYGFSHVTLVLFDLYGADDWRTKFMTAAVDAALHRTVLPLPDEEVSLDLVHVEDAVEAFMLAGASLCSGTGELHGTSYAVSAGERHRLRDIVRLIEGIADIRVETALGDYRRPGRRMTQPWQGASLPCWQPRRTLEQGIRELIAARRVRGDASTQANIDRQ